MSDTTTYLVGLNVLSGRGEAKGATRGHICSECGGECWLAPEGVRLLQDHSRVQALICDRCAYKTIEDSEEPIISIISPPTDEQMEAINAYLKERGKPPVTKEAMLEVAREKLLGRSRLN